MGRPRNPLSNYQPAISQGIAAVTLETDQGAQIISATFVAGTPGGVNIQLNSLRTSNVIGMFYPAAGQSFRVQFYEVTDPSVSAFVWGLQNANNTGQILNQNVYGKLTLLQRA